MGGVITSLSMLMLFFGLNASAMPDGDDDDDDDGGGNWSTKANTIRHNYSFGTKNAFPILFKTNNIQRMVLTSNGFFGIDVLTPLAPLHTNGDVIFNTLIGTGIGLVYTGADGKISRYSFTGNNRHVLLGDGTFGEYSDNDWTVDGNNIYNQNTGNVGINTQTPEYQLDVNGDAKVRGEFSVGNSIKFNGITDQITTTTGNLDFGTTNLSTDGTIKTNSIISNSGTLNLGSTNITTTGNISGGGVTFSGSSIFDDITVNHVTSTDILTANGITIKNGIRFAEASSSIASVGDLNIETQGNVKINTTGNTIINSKLGIGTDSPIEMLDVAGNANIQGYLYVQDGVIIGRRISGEKVSADTVEINEKLSAKELDILQKISAERIELNQELKAKDVEASEKFRTSTITIDGPNSTISSTTGAINFADENLTTTGTVNAGTISATTITTDDLTIVNPVSLAELTVTDKLKIGTNTLVLSSTQGSTTVENSIYSESGDLLIQSNALNTNNTILNFSNDGKVGVGTNNPLGKFQVGSGMSKVVISDHFVIPNTYWNASYIGFNAARNESTGLWNIGTNNHDNGGTVILNDVGGNMRFISVKSNQEAGAPERNLTDESILNNTKLVINKEGKIGIGTPNPQKTLHIRDYTPSDVIIANPDLSDIGGSLRLENEVEFQGTTIWDLEPIYNISDPTLTRLQFTNQGNAVLSLNQSGKVGIGTSDPKEKFEVLGSGRFGNTNGYIKIGYNSSHAFLDGYDTNDGDKSLLINWYSGSNVTVGGGPTSESTTGTGTFGTRHATTLCTTSGNVTIGSGGNHANLDLKGNLKINNNDILLKIGSGNHGLGYYGKDNPDDGTGRFFASENVFGPVLYGKGGGALATKYGASENIVLQWYENGEVKINNLGNTANETKMVVAEADGTLITQEIPALLSSATSDASGNIGLGATGTTTTLNGSNIELGDAGSNSSIGINGNIQLPLATANASDAVSPGILLSTSVGDKFEYNSLHLNHYGLGFHHPVTTSGTGSGAYLSGYYGIDLFTGAISLNPKPSLSIKQNGKVGIGTDNPKEKLQIGELFTFHSSGTKMIGRNVYYNGSDKKIIGGGSESYSSAIKFNANGSIWFNVDNNTTAGADDNITWKIPLKILETGNIAIGDPTSLSSALNVKGSINFEGLNPLPTAAPNPQMLVVDDDGNVGTKDVSSLCNAITCDGNDNVGIGTSNIQSKLSVNGNASFVSTSDYNNSFQIGNTIPKRRGISLDGDPSGKINFWIHDWQNDAAFNFMKNNDGTGSSTTQLMTISKNGNVGIGTSTPQADLHIFNSATNDNTKTTLRLHRSSNTGAAFSYWDIENSGAYLNFNHNDQTFLSMSYGIDPNPTPILHVYGTISSDYQNNLRWTNNNWTTALMSPNGSVWRTKNASTTLNRYLGLGMTDGGWYWISSTTDDDQGISHYHMKLNVLNDAEHTAILSVEGKIWAKEVKVRPTNPYADYVFKPDYELKTLSEVENYINKYKHLPDVPSEKEIDDAGGISLGDMDVILLKKIEELTLYTIQQQKKIDNLECEMETLKSK